MDGYELYEKWCELGMSEISGGNEWEHYPKVKEYIFDYLANRVPSLVDVEEWVRDMGEEERPYFKEHVKWVKEHIDERTKELYGQLYGLENGYRAYFFSSEDVIGILDMWMVFDKDGNCEGHHVEDD